MSGACSAFSKAAPTALPLPSAVEESASAEDGEENLQSPSLRSPTPSDDVLLHESGQEDVCPWVFEKHGFTLSVWPGGQCRLQKDEEFVDLQLSEDARLGVSSKDAGRVFIGSPSRAFEAVFADAELRAVASEFRGPQKVVEPPAAKRGRLSEPKSDGGSINVSKGKQGKGHGKAAGQVGHGKGTLGQGKNGKSEQGKGKVNDTATHMDLDQLYDSSFMPDKVDLQDLLYLGAALPAQESSSKTATVSVQSKGNGKASGPVKGGMKGNGKSNSKSRSPSSVFWFGSPAGNTTTLLVQHALSDLLASLNDLVAGQKVDLHDVFPSLSSECEDGRIIQLTSSPQTAIAPKERNEEHWQAFTYNAQCVHSAKTTQDAELERELGIEGTVVSVDLKYKSNAVPFLVVKLRDSNDEQHFKIILWNCQRDWVVSGQYYLMLGMKVQQDVEWTEVNGVGKFTPTNDRVLHGGWRALLLPC
mmetsp:Transcript_9469/g.16848  ORF Transcript_9469/g.16848 Transcript_9469/m.16848 type:complete len:473 (-) Transcript_9469:266-1684(-)